MTWTNTDTAAHQVVGDRGAFTSPVLQPGQSYSFTFTTSGKFDYHDATQPKRKGSVTVSANAPVVTLTASKKQVTYGGTLTLSGSVSPQQTGQKVTVLARECNTTNYVPVGDAITTTGGAWSFVVKPHRLTVYEARWKRRDEPRRGGQRRAARPDREAALAPALRRQGDRGRSRTWASTCCFSATARRSAAG